MRSCATFLGFIFQLTRPFSNEIFLNGRWKRLSAMQSAYIQSLSDTPLWKYVNSCVVTDGKLNLHDPIMVALSVTLLALGEDSDQKGEQMKKMLIEMADSSSTVVPSSSFMVGVCKSIGVHLGWEDVDQELLKAILVLLARTLSVSSTEAHPRDRFRYCSDLLVSQFRAQIWQLVESRADVPREIAPIPRCPSALVSVISIMRVSNVMHENLIELVRSYVDTPFWRILSLGGQVRPWDSSMPDEDPLDKDELTEEDYVLQWRCGHVCRMEHSIGAHDGFVRNCQVCGQRWPMPYRFSAARAAEGPAAGGPATGGPATGAAAGDSPGRELDDEMGLE